MKNLFRSVLFSALALTGCATHQLRFQPWKGIPDADLFTVSKGQFAIPKEKLLDAAASTLEHEPYFHWTFDSFDKGNGLMVGSAGLFREVQIRVTDTEGGGSKMSVSIPRRELKATAKIYVKKSDPKFQTAYAPEQDKLDEFNVVSAKAVLNPEYFYSFTYRVLNDRTQVPFVMTSLAEGETVGQPPVEEKPVVEAAPKPEAGTLPPVRRE